MRIINLVVTSLVLLGAAPAVASGGTSLVVKERPNLSTTTTTSSTTTTTVATTTSSAPQAPAPVHVTIGARQLSGREAVVVLDVRGSSVGIATMRVFSGTTCGREVARGRVRVNSSGRGVLRARGRFSGGRYSARVSYATWTSSCLVMGAPSASGGGFAGSTAATGQGTPGVANHVNLRACLSNLAAIERYMREHTWSSVLAQLDRTGKSPYAALNSAVLSTCDVAHLRSFSYGPYRVWTQGRGASGSTSTTIPTVVHAGGGTSIGQVGTPGLG